MKANFKANELPVIRRRLRDWSHKGVLARQSLAIARHEKAATMQQSTRCLVSAMLRIEPYLVAFFQAFG